MFAVATAMSTTAAKVCLFDRHDVESSFPLTQRIGAIWWTHVEGVGEGSRYGFRVEGPGQNAAKLLVDPYARAIDGAVDWVRSVGSFDALDPRDTARFVPRSVVVDTRFDWGGDTRPLIPWWDSIVYEVHVKGATQLLDAVPVELRGTYAGLCHPAFIAHLHRLGVTSLELLPIHHIGHEERLVLNGMTNFWGYNTLGFFAPHDAYSASGTTGQQVREFKEMVKRLHAAGIEVLLDVVYNHTCEGGRGGPVISFRGLDPHGWYRNEDTTGCGNTVDMDDPLALRLVLDSLRYWIEEMHIDGFRFDLATALGRGPDGYSARSRFLAAAAQDPVISNVKLIAEPWDTGPHGYQVGGFPAPWTEWNDRYRDTVRDFWGDAPCPQGEVAQRITGSADLFWGAHRAPWTSVNFVTAHDGFTLLDLVSYSTKHNLANGEENRDGTNNNRAWNGGIEGPTTDPVISAHRRRQQRNLLAMLLLSQGTPMLLAGDELGRTQRGNNNAYCQDNELSWIDWASADQELIDFVARCIQLRKRHEVLGSPTWLQPEDAAWFAPDATSMTTQRWNNPDEGGLTLVLKAEREHLAFLFNEFRTDQPFTLPYKGPWTVELSTDTVLSAGAVLPLKCVVPASTLLVLSAPR
jgi:isoamylase